MSSFQEGDNRGQHLWHQRRELELSGLPFPELEAADTLRGGRGEKVMRYVLLVVRLDLRGTHHSAPFHPP